MERLRQDLIQRARAERHGDGGQPASHVATPESRDGVDLENNRARTTRPALGLLRLPNLIGRRRERASTDRRDQDDDELESPKSPEIGTRRAAFHLPNIGQLLSRGPHTQLPTAEPQHPSAPQPVHPREHGRANASSLDTPDPANVLLAQMADDGRRRRRGRDRRRARDGQGPRSKPKRFLGCLPWSRSRRTRSLVVRCLISGLIFGILLAVYLGLAASNTLNTGEQTLMLMLIILLATAFFCYSLLRLCLIVVRGGRQSANRGRAAGQPGSSGYAIPSQPIRVVMARDEEAAGLESETQKITPPAYGLWRSSVRVDPDRLFWQRNDPNNITPRIPEGIVGSRPPSYASDDGISYVVDAVPRSTVPVMTQVPMPTHPSEVGRLAQRPA